MTASPAEKAVDVSRSPVAPLPKAEATVNAHSSLEVMPPTEPNVTLTSSLAQAPHSESTYNMPPSSALLPPNDTSVILLLAAEARADHEVEEMLGMLAVDRQYSKEELTPVNTLVLRIHQQLQERHGLPVDTEIRFQTETVKASLNKSWGVRFNELYIARKGLELLYARRRSDLDTRPFPFARLPLELRQEVYGYALAGDCRRIMVNMRLIKKHREIRGSEWWVPKKYPDWENPILRFRSGSIGQGMGISVAILRTSRTIHEEAEAILYQLHEFDFEDEVFAVAPFFRSISHNARQNISCITMHVHDFLGNRITGGNPDGRADANPRDNKQHWGPACSYIAQNVRLRELAFHINITEMASLTNRSTGSPWEFYECEPPKDFQNLSWVQDMTQIKGLWSLTYYNEVHDHDSIEERAELGPEDQDRLTTGVSAPKQELLSYLKSQMLTSPATGT